MGNTKPHYSREQFLYYCIEKRDYTRMSDTLTQYPDLINRPLTKDIKHTAIMRAAFNNDLTAARQLLLRGADLDARSRKGETALTISINRNHLPMVQFLLENGANCNPTADNGLRAIDYAVLRGHYVIAQCIFHRLSTEEKTFRDPRNYEELAKRFATRYANYDMILKGLVLQTPQHELGDYLTKEKTLMVDPVVDPRENWKEWVKRQMEFKDAPLVERDVLPENLQPQNRILGKIHHYTHNFMKTPLTQKTSLKPLRNVECVSEMAEINKKKADQNKESMSEWNA